MGIEDLSIIESQWRVRLSEDPAPELFDGIGARLSQYYCGADIERESVNRDLIGFAKAFVGWSADPKSDERIRRFMRAWARMRTGRGSCERVLGRMGLIALGMATPIRTSLRR